MKNIFIITILFLSITFAQVSWKVDKSHSKIGFSVTHLVITDVEGQFNKFDGVVSSKDINFNDPKIEIIIDAASINTDNEGRDKHLRADDFFNTEKFPEIKFVGQQYKKVGKNKFKLTGDLTLKDVTKKVTFNVEQRGPVKDFNGKLRAGFKISTVINRFDYNLKWDSVVEAGPVVGKEVTININFEIIQDSK